MNVQDASELWGPFIYYDMFSLDGFEDWVLTALILDFAFLYEFIYAFERAAANDWTLGTVELGNHIDMNRLAPGELAPAPSSPFDIENFIAEPDGMDCNGNRGLGYYCHCPSQGYVCECAQNPWYGPGEVIMECTDHFGYSCSGEWVDGEENWC